MKVSLIQMDVAWLDAAANRERAERLMRSAEKSDVYVLPEMWNTGVTTQPAGIASPEPSREGGNGGDTLLWMQRMADELDAAVAGSVAVRTSDGSYRNRLYFVKPQDIANSKLSDCKWYDKHHLFSYGGETDCYTPGNERVTVEWRGVRFRLSVCYDLRFPLWLRNRDDYDALICVASWPAARVHAWNVLLQARAIENQCYIIGVNRTGTGGGLDYPGHSAVYSPEGQVCTPLSGDETLILADLDPAHVRTYRQNFPTKKDRRRELYGKLKVSS